METSKTTMSTSAVPITTVPITKAVLTTICASQRWQEFVLTSAGEKSITSRLALDLSSLLECSNHAFDQLSEQDWLEAFAGHPMIGDISSLREKYAQGKHLSEKEQSQVSQASESVLHELLTLNHRYLDKFGFIFIVCATNKSADEMLTILQTRILNSRADELKNAAIEQKKISHIRMEKLF